MKGMDLAFIVTTTEMFTRVTGRKTSAMEQESTPISVRGCNTLELGLKATEKLKDNS